MVSPLARRHARGQKHALAGLEPGREFRPLPVRNGDGDGDGDGDGSGNGSGNTGEGGEGDSGGSGGGGGGPASSQVKPRADPKKLARRLKNVVLGTARLHTLKQATQHKKEGGRGKVKSGRRNKGKRGQEWNGRAGGGAGPGGGSRDLLDSNAFDKRGRWYPDEQPPDPDVFRDRAAPAMIRHSCDLSGDDGGGGAGGGGTGAGTGAAGAALVAFIKGGQGR